jgi:hypothetical protein
MTETLEEELENVSADDCRVCLGEHEDDIHSATLSVHAWYRGHVTRYFVEEEVDAQCVA